MYGSFHPWIRFIHGVPKSHYFEGRIPQLSYGFHLLSWVLFNIYLNELIMNDLMNCNSFMMNSPMNPYNPYVFKL